MGTDTLQVLEAMDLRSSTSGSSSLWAQFQHYTRISSHSDNFRACKGHGQWPSVPKPSHCDRTRLFGQASSTSRDLKDPKAPTDCPRVGQHTLIPSSATLEYPPHALLQPDWRISTLVDAQAYTLKASGPSLYCLRLDLSLLSLSSGASFIAQPLPSHDSRP